MCVCVCVCVGAAVNDFPNSVCIRWLLWTGQQSPLQKVLERKWRRNEEEESIEREREREREREGGGVRERDGRKIRKTKR